MALFIRKKPTLSDQAKASAKNLIATELKLSKRFIIFSTGTSESGKNWIRGFNGRKYSTKYEY